MSGGHHIFWHEKGSIGSQEVITYSGTKNAQLDVRRSSHILGRDTLNWMSGGHHIYWHETRSIGCQERFWHEKRSILHLELRERQAFVAPGFEQRWRLCHQMLQARSQATHPWQRRVEEVIMLFFSKFLTCERNEK